MVQGWPAEQGYSVQTRLQSAQRRVSIATLYIGVHNSGREHQFVQALQAAVMDSARRLQVVVLLDALRGTRPSTTGTGAPHWLSYINSLQVLAVPVAVCNAPERALYSGIGMKLLYLTATCLEHANSSLGLKMQLEEFGLLVEKLLLPIFNRHNGEQRLLAVKLPTARL